MDALERGGKRRCRLRSAGRRPSALLFPCFDNDLILSQPYLNFITKIFFYIKIHANNTLLH